MKICIIPSSFSFSPFPYVSIYVCIEEDKQNEWDDAQSNKTSPIKINGVVWIQSSDKI